MQRTTIFLCLLCLLFTVSSYSSPQDFPVPRADAGHHNRDDEPPAVEQIQKEMEKKANQQRQADLKRDTDQLLKLATELKQYVDKTNENVMSVDVIKKADEIEKLAHSVKTKMRGDE